MKFIVCSKEELDPPIAKDMIDAGIIVLAYLLGAGTGAGLVLLYLSQVMS